MDSENQKMQKRLEEVKSKIGVLNFQKEQNDKEKVAIQQSLEKLGIKDVEELNKLIESKQATLTLTKKKFEEALVKLEENTTTLELKVKG